MLRIFQKNIKKSKKIQQEIMQIEAISLTHRGKVRARNEDNLYFAYRFLPLEHNEHTELMEWKDSTEKMQVVAVFDGMGGECAGDLASYTSASEFHSLYSEPLKEEEALTKNQITELLLQVNNMVCRAAEEQHYRLIGSTASILFFHRGTGILANLGDSPVYRLRDGKMKLLSHPHTNAELLEKHGINRKPALTQFLGVDAEEFVIEPYVEEIPLKKQDIYLLCSDGLTDMVDESRIQEILAMDLQVKEQCQMLRDEALENGGRDNITIILCKVS